MLMKYLLYARTHVGTEAKTVNEAGMAIVSLELIF